MTATLKADLVLDAGARLAEGPIWDTQRGQLWWVDIPAGLVHRYDPRHGHDTAFNVGSPVGAVAPRAAGGLVLAIRDGFAFCGTRGEDLVLAVPVQADDPGVRMNDGKCDANGRFWAGTMATDGRGSAGRLYRLNSSRQVHTMLPAVTISNGLGWSPDGRTMYYVDTPTGGIDAFDFDPYDGAISGRRRLVGVEGGRPDGLTVDADGGVWVAVWMGSAVRRYTPDGGLDAEVRLPVERVTSCTFGGAHLDTLYVTTARHRLTDAELARQPHAGGIFALTPGPAGLPPGAFAG